MERGRDGPRAERKTDIFPSGSSRGSVAGHPLYVNADEKTGKGGRREGRNGEGGTPSKNLISPSTRVNTENTCCRRLMNFHS